MDKLKIKSPIIVEGKYDKIKLDSLVDGLILCSNGFRIFKDKQKLALIRRLANETGIIILTDSDVAGFKLRNFIKQCVKDAKVINIYIPQIEGKEHRKDAPSKQGFLGVEGMDIDLLRKLFLEAGVLENTSDLSMGHPPPDPITRMDFYDSGLIGSSNSAANRQALLAFLKLPSYITTNSLLAIINRIMTKQQFNDYINSTRRD